MCVLPLPNWRRGVVGAAGEPAQHEADMFAKRTCEAGAGEEPRRVVVILGSGTGHHLLKRDGELVTSEPPCAAGGLCTRVT